MRDRLGGVVSVFVGQYLRLRARYKRAKTETRRLQRLHETETRDLENTIATLRQNLREAEDFSEIETDRADTAERHLEAAKSDIEILKARDEMWAKWESRERARLDAETARLAAAKARALDNPQFEEG